MESDYSEDFEEEEVGSGAAPSSKPSAGSLSVQQRSLAGLERRTQRATSRPPVQMYGTPSRRLAPASQTTTKSKSTGAVGRARETQLSRRTQSFLPRKLQPAKLANCSPARDRQLSAMNHTVRSLQNKLAEKSKRLEETSKENRLLNRLQRRQDREWTRIQRQEDELPQLLQRHEQEVRALRKQLRKSHEEVMTGQQKVGELQDEIHRLSNTNRKLENVVGKKKLLERDYLTEQVHQLTRALADRDKRIAELERGLEATGKSHTQELRGLQLRNKALASETNTLRDTAHKLRNQLMEKTKEMDVLNIYTQRIPRSTLKPSPPSPPPSPTQPPPPPAVTHQSSQTAISCPPFKTVSMQHRSQLRAAASQTDVVRSESVETATQTMNDALLPAPALPTTSYNTVGVKMETTLNSMRVTAEPHSVQSVPEDSGQDAIREQRSKHMLLQRLRELDGQKTAPGSNPIPPVQTSGTSTASTVATHHTHTASVPAEVKPSVSLSEAAASERERNQLLLAKLMAIDEGNNPNHVKPSLQNSQKHTLPGVQEVANNPHGIAANKSSSSSLSSWPEVIENMHQGKPAHASENDPFGSRSRLSSLKRGGRGGRRESGGVGSAKEEAVISAELFPKPVPGRWEMGGEKTPTNQQPGKKDDHYKPSFGRRAHAERDQPHTDSHPLQASLPPPQEEKKLLEPPILSPSVTTGRGGLLPRRPKADAAAMRSHDVMPGAVISEPDDLEELVL